MGTDTDTRTGATRTHVMRMAGRFRPAMLVQHAVVSGLLSGSARPRSAEQVAAAHGWQLRRTRALLDALAALGILEPTTYELRRDVAHLFDRDHPGYVGDMVVHEHAQQQLWLDLDRVLRATKALPEQQDVTMATDAARLETLLRAMRQVDAGLIEATVALPEWAGATHVLDLAGGHGAFLAALACRYPELGGTVVDQTYAETTALDTFVLADVADRCGFATRDLMSSDPLQGLRGDGVLLARCLHNFSAPAIASLLEACRRVLDPGGVLVVVESRLDEVDGQMRPPENALFGAYMAVNCVGGWVPPTAWMIETLSGLGGDLRTQPVSDVQLAFIVTWGRA